MNNILKISPEIKKALKEGKPIVALESTIISHGMPYPENAQTAFQAEKIIRDNGGIPATIAILNGIMTVGLTKEEIDYLGRIGSQAHKVSTRDIPYIVSKKLNGATTVSATSSIANMAGIKVFATGGIGGVHRDAQKTFDISADLEELANTNICVVCAGAKSILDLGLTLEYLETKRIEIIGYQTSALPAFYCNTSEFKVNHTLDTPLEIATLLKTKFDLHLSGGVIVANPIPDEYSMDEKEIDKAIEEALKEMNELKITGNKTTPFLLAKIKDLTKGKSLASNIKLVYNNCKLATEIAINLANIAKEKMD